MTCCRSAFTVLLASALFHCAPVVFADDSPARGFGLRNQHPLHQLYGLPAFRSAAITEPGATALEISLDFTNQADEGSNAREDFRIDGETHYLTLSLRRRMAAWLELGIDVPLVSHNDGYMDNMIESWHDLWGLSNSKRNGPSNRLLYRYERDGAERLFLDSSASGLGDIQVSAAIPIREAADGRAAVTVRSSVKLPSGDSGSLLGSGAADFATGLYVSDSTTLRDRALGIGGFAGVLLLGDGDVLGDLQRDAVVFGGLSVTWQFTDRTALVSQLYGQGSYYDSDIDELGGKSLQLAVGADHRTRGGTLLRLAIVEDIAANATPDFAVHFSIALRP